MCTVVAKPKLNPMVTQPASKFVSLCIELLARKTILNYLQTAAHPFCLTYSQPRHWIAMEHKSGRKEWNQGFVMMLTTYLCTELIA